MVSKIKINWILTCTKRFLAKFPFFKDFLYSKIQKQTSIFDLPWPCITIKIFQRAWTWYTILGKLKQSGKVDFFRKNPRIQFDVFFDSESNGCIFGSLAPFGGELWRFKKFKFVRHLQPTQKNFWRIFLSQSVE